MNPENGSLMLKLIDIVKDRLGFPAMFRLTFGVGGLDSDLPYATEAPDCKTSMPVIRPKFVFKGFIVFLLTDEQFVSRIRHHKRDTLSYRSFCA